jgi:hypothetical protein
VPAERPATPAPLDPARSIPPQPPGALPRRVPGGSDLRVPRRIALVRPLDAPPAEADAAPTVPLPAISGSAAPYAAARRSGPDASSPRAVPPVFAALPTPPSVAVAALSPPPVPSRAAARRRVTAPHALRWWLAGVAVIAAIAALVVALYPRDAGLQSRGSARLAAQTLARNQAAAWVAGQVGHDILVACDALTCADLAQDGFPAADLNVLQSSAPDLYGTQVVVATASVRSQFGGQLASVFAPEVLASFGTGVNRIDIRVVAPDGPVAFRTALSADLRARKSAAAQLLTRSTVTASAAARSALVAGDVDSRLLTVLAFLAGQEPIDIVSFGGAAPGASPGVPLRSADLAASDPVDGQSGAGYERSLMSLVHSGVALYAPASVMAVRLGSGRHAVQISYAAPSPLGLLGGAG